MFLKISFLVACIFLPVSYAMEIESFKRKANEYLTGPDTKKVAPIGQFHSSLLPGIIYVCRFVTIDRQVCNQIFDTRGKMKCHLRAKHQISGNTFERYCIIQEKNN